MSIYVFSCTDKDDPALKSAEGVLKKLEASTFMYGTHLLETDSGTIQYALKSKTVNLDLYNDEKVKVKGNLIDGYPVDGGPEYMEVKEIERINK